MDLHIIEININIIIHRLRELETPEVRKYYTKEQLQQSKEFATNLFRSLLIKRDELKQIN
jgi:hypothetical protein